MTVSFSPILLLLFIFVLSCSAWKVVHLNYYQKPSSPQGYIGYGGTTCNLKEDLSFSNISNIDPELSCKQRERSCVPFAGCMAAQVDCKVRSSYSDPVDCEKVKRICEVSLKGELGYGTCKYVDVPPGDCCYHLKDRATGLWEKNRQGSCPFLCLGVVSVPGLEWCKTCTCINSDRGTGQGGTRSYSSLC